MTKLFKGFLLAIFLLILADLLASFIFFQRVQHFARSQPHDQKADVAVVFMGGINWDNYELETGTKKRLDHALQLYHNNRVNYIVCVGGALKGKEFPGSQIMKKYLIRHGLPENRIFTDSLSYDTRTNWREAKKIINAHDFSSVIAVSSALHLYRISGIAKGKNIYYSASPYQISSWSNWWFIEENIHYEWLAYAMYAILPDSIYFRLVRWQRKAV